MENNTLAIRNGAEKDLDAFFELYWISSVEHTKYNEVLDAVKSKNQCKEYILGRQRIYLNDPNHLFLVAEDHEKIVGMITGHIGERDDAYIYTVETIGFIDEFCVLPEYRKRGIGTQLVEKLLNELDQRNVAFAGVGVACQNPVMDFYQAHGFSVESMWMVRKMGDNEIKKESIFHRYDPYGRGKATIPFTVKVKPREVMGEYIALHGLVPQNELPEHLRHKIPEDEIWIREDVYEDPKRRDQILQGHEKYELALMETKGLTYKQAHAKAEVHEKVYKFEEKLEEIEKDLNIKSFDPVIVVDKTSESKPNKQKESSKKQDEES